MFDALRSLFSPPDDEYTARAPWWSPLISQLWSHVLTLYIGVKHKETIDAHGTRLSSIDQSVGWIEKAQRSTVRRLFVVEQALGIDPNAAKGLADAADLGDLDAVRKWLDACAPKLQVDGADLTARIDARLAEQVGSAFAGFKMGAEAVAKLRRESGETADRSERPSADAMCGMLADIETAANAGNLDGIRELFARAHAAHAAEQK